jgi:hypothetical protein
MDFVQQMDRLLTTTHHEGLWKIPRNGFSAIDLNPNKCARGLATMEREGHPTRGSQTTGEPGTG